MKRLQDRIALVTGAARGIGHGIALCLAGEGAEVAINDLVSLEEAQESLSAIARLGRRALYWQADVADRDEVARMIDGAVEHFGRIDIVVANAGISIPQPVIEAQWEDVLRTIQVTQFGVFHTCQMAARRMAKQALDGRRGGKIVIISSVHEELAVRGCAAYNMAKAAATQLGRTLAVELAPHRINVNVVHPGLTDTPATRFSASDEEIYRASRRIPLGRLGTPDDIGKAVAFLASDDADYITGATLRVDGGFVLGLRFPLDD